MKIKYFAIAFLGIGLCMSLTKIPHQKTQKNPNIEFNLDKNSPELALRYEMPCFSTRFGEEVTTNLFKVHSLEKDLPEKLEEYLPYYDQVIQKLDMGTLHFDQEKSLFTKLIFLLQIRHIAGWEPYNQLYEKYKEMSEADVAKYCKNDQTKLDFFYRKICELSQVDFTAHFEAWKLPISTKSKIYVAQLNLKSPYTEVSRITPAWYIPLKKAIIKLKNVNTNRLLLSTGEEVNPEGEKNWANNPPVLGTDLDYFGRAQWFLIKMRSGDTYLLKNKVTQRYLFSVGEAPVKYESDWLKSPAILGTAGNYEGRAEWTITRNGNSNTFFLKNKITKRFLLSDGEAPTVDNEGGYSKSPKIVGSDRNYYNRALWSISGPGLKLLE